MRQSVRRHARAIAVPPLTEPRIVMRGRVLHDEHCVSCHGAPGVAPEAYALGLTPHTRQSRAHGARMVPRRAVLGRQARHQDDGHAGMGVSSGRRRHLGDRRLSAGSGPRIAAAVSVRGIERYTFGPPRAQPAPTLAATRPGAWKVAIQQYACASCHVIPGIVGARATVGPPLTGIAIRGFIAGILPNTVDNMVRWLQAPQAVYSEGAMPNLGVTERDARDIAAYLSTLK